MFFSEGVAGHVLWYSAGSRDLYGSQLTTFYDVAGQGRAANPHFGDARRPAPIVGSLVSAGNWSFNVTNPGRYRIVSTSGSIWGEFDTATFGVGQFSVNIPGATQVELLADRRPLAVADFNGDGLVNAGDYIHWRNTFGSTTDLRADANANGIVDGLDYEKWRSTFGMLAAGGAAASSIGQDNAVPEPGTCALASFATACLLWCLLSGKPRIR